MAQLRSELFKLRTTRTTLILALGMVAIVLAATLGQGLATDASDLGRESTQRGFFATGGLGLIFAALVGIMAVTGEFRHGTIRPTLVFSPRRERVLAAKVAVAAAAGLVLTATAETLVLGIGYATFRSRGIDVVLSGSEIGAIAGGTLAAGALWGGIGFNFQRTEQNFTTYSSSVGKFANVAKARNVDVQMANHSNFDRAFEKISALKARRAGQPNPFVVGWDVQQRIFDVQQECALAQRATLRTAASKK
jgi:hypothetical protein